MTRGAKTALLISSVAIGGCTGAAPEVKVRAIASPSAAIARSGDATAVARAQLLLGNVGLALEAYRKAQRENAADPAVLAGIADCYSAMGRFDLAQTNYEAALALAPNDSKLLLGLAAIYERGGKTARAMVVRAEAAAALTSAAVTAPKTMTAAPASRKLAVAEPVASPRASAAIPKPAIGSITIELPAARPASRLRSRDIEPTISELQLADAKPVEVTVSAPASAAEPMIPRPALTIVTVDLPKAVPSSYMHAHNMLSARELAFADPEDADEMAAGLDASAEMVFEQSSRSVEVELPKSRPVEQLGGRQLAAAVLQIDDDVAPSSAALAPPAARPTRPAPVPLPREDDRRNTAVAIAVAPRLERLSRGEVALVTTGKTLWRSPEGVRTATASATVRWVALNSLRDRPNVRILNAARSQGLAASARTVLVDRGWRKIAVGDAPAVVGKSVVLYPKGREELGRRLARQFGVSAQMAERDDVVLLLGRDSIRRIGG